MADSFINDWHLTKRPGRRAGKHDGSISNRNGAAVWTANRVPKVAYRQATVDRLNAFSDNVFSIVITILVLELNPPIHPTFAALLALWRRAPAMW
jgi:hypothetical protein